MYNRRRAEQRGGRVCGMTSYWDNWLLPCNNGRGREADNISCKCVCLCMYINVYLMLLVHLAGWSFSYTVNMSLLTQPTVFISQPELKVILCFFSCWTSFDPALIPTSYGWLVWTRSTLAQLAFHYCSFFFYWCLTICHLMFSSRHRAFPPAHFPFGVFAQC